MTLRLLAIADTFGTLVKNAIQENIEKVQQCHALLLLGDLPATAYPAIRKDLNLNTSGFCVLGNHDGADWGDWLPRYKFQHVHLNTATLRVDGREMTICGFGGSERYREGAWQWEDCEANRLLKKLAPCDIFLSHTAGAHPQGSSAEDNRHRGLPGIQEYIQKQQPRLALHGHFHHNYRQRMGVTNVVGCYGAVLIECEIEDRVWEIKTEPLVSMNGWVK